MQIRYNFSKQLVRNFIYDRLYHQDSGYFTGKQIQLGQLKEPIEFKNLLGYEDYMNLLQNNYPQHKWLTPSEIFRPYYGITIGNYIYQQFRYVQQKQRKIDKIRIIEVGAGYGAACEGVVHFIKNYSPELLPSFEYHLVELSPIACQQSEERLKEEFAPLLKKGQIRIVNTDFINYKPQVYQNELWFIICLEVFDNLPHDKVIKISGQPQEVLVDYEKLTEILQPLNDSLIKEVYAHYEHFIQTNPIQVEEKSWYHRVTSNLVKKYYGTDNQQAIYLPTGSVQMLKHIQQFPNMSLIIADFDMLKNQFSSNEGICSPIVSRKLAKPHEKQDYPNYLVERGIADIFFPTNFLFLQYLIKKIIGQQTQIYKSYEFVEMFSKTQWTTTKSGYNPLKEDFGNTSFLVSDHQ